jgi:hypothetical protein
MNKVVEYETDLMHYTFNQGLDAVNFEIWFPTLWRDDFTWSERAASSKIHAGRKWEYHFPVNSKIREISHCTCSFYYHTMN